MNLGEVAPTIDALLALEADELGLRLLPLLKQRFMQGGGLSLRELLSENFYDVFTPKDGSRRAGPYPGREGDAVAVVIEAWAWLEGQGLVVPRLMDNSEAHKNARTLSRRALQLATNPQRARGSRLLPKESLHPLIREDVWALFHRGKYDTAVFEAMKAVEVEVRSAAGLQPTDIGVDLMRKAFHVQNGPLSDMTTTGGEREARSSFFAGAIGSYKNPHSHRDVALNDPDEAAEILMLASHLLRIVDARLEARLGAGVESEPSHG